MYFDGFTYSSHVQAYLSCEKGAEPAKIEWHTDFSCSGLAVHRMEARMRCGWGKGNAISFTVQGDNRVFCSPELGGKMFDTCDHP